VAIVDPRSSLKVFAGMPIVGSYEEFEDLPGIVVLTELKAAQETYAVAVARFGVERVLVPSMLGVETATAERMLA
jgi:hypothetical protein